MRLNDVGAKLPLWVPQVITAALLGLGLNWATGVAREVQATKSDVAVLQNDREHVTEDIKQIRASERRIEDKLDAVLTRRR